jgi:hypothetical protein
VPLERGKKNEQTLEHVIKIRKLRLLNPANDDDDDYDFIHLLIKVLQSSWHIPKA